MTASVRPSLPSAERLKSKKEIEELFKKSSSFFVKPILLKFVVLPGESPHKILVVVPKKNFKKATDRNLLKRRIREAYRQNKQILPQGQQHLHLAFLYLHKDILTFHQIQQKLITLMERLQQKLA